MRTDYGRNFRTFMDILREEVPGCSHNFLDMLEKESTFRGINECTDNGQLVPVSMGPASVGRSSRSISSVNQKVIMRELCKQNVKLRQNVCKLEKMIEQKKKKIAQLSRDRQTVEAKKKQSLRNYYDLCSRYILLQEARHKKRMAIQRKEHTKEKQMQQAMIQQQKEEIKHLNGNIGNLEVEIQNRDAEIRQLNSDNNDLNAIIRGLNAEIEGLNYQVSQQQSIIEGKNKNEHDLRRESKTLKIIIIIIAIVLLLWVYYSSNGF